MLATTLVPMLQPTRWIGSVADELTAYRCAAPTTLAPAAGAADARVVEQAAMDASGRSTERAAR